MSAHESDADYPRPLGAVPYRANLKMVENENTYPVNNALDAEFDAGVTLMAALHNTHKEPSTAQLRERVEAARAYIVAAQAALTAIRVAADPIAKTSTTFNK